VGVSIGSGKESAVKATIDSVNHYHDSIIDLSKLS
jgi:hypothetical protein